VTGAALSNSHIPDHRRDFPLSVEGDGFEMNRPKPARFGQIENRTPGAGTKGTEKNAFSSPYREQLSRLLSSPEQMHPQNPRDFGPFALKKYDDPKLAGGARVTGIEPSPHSPGQPRVVYRTI
jgi:hypothetical protein